MPAAQFLGHCLVLAALWAAPVIITLILGW